MITAMDLYIEARIAMRDLPEVRLCTRESKVWDSTRLIATVPTGGRRQLVVLDVAREHMVTEERAFAETVGRSMRRHVGATLGKVAGDDAA